MKRIKAPRFLFFTGVVICLFSTYMNHRHNQKLLHRDFLEKVQWLKTQDIVSKHQVKHIMVKKQEETIQLVSLAQSGVRIGIYAHRLQCTNCWKTVANNINNICKTYHITEPFILFDGFRPSDIRIMERDDSLKIEHFSVVDYEDPYLQSLSRVGKPYVFLLNPDSTISSIMYYDDAIVPMIKEFFKSLSIDSIYPGHIKIQNQHIQLGKIPCRKEFKIHYIIKNESRNVCNIKKIIPSCTCLQVENNFKQILPGETKILDIVFFSDVYGPFRREIELYTDTRNEPYILSIEGDSQ